MKNSFYIIIALAIIFSNCTKSNNVESKNEVRDEARLEEDVSGPNISDSEETVNYLTDTKTDGKFDSIYSANDYIFKENFVLRGGKYYNLQDVSACFTTYNLISEVTKESIHGGFYTEYFIKGDQYTVMIHDIHGYSGGYKIYPVEFELNEKNYLNWFPYRTMDKYLTDDNFGEIDEIKEDAIEYEVNYGWGWCSLWFSNGLLKSLKLAHRID